MSKVPFKVVWSETAKEDLKEIYSFIKLKSPQGAKNVIVDIRLSVKNIYYAEQYQVEEYFPICRRVVVRNYKVLYIVKEDNHELNVVRVFDTRQHPNKMNL